MSDQFCEHREIISQKDAEIEKLKSRILDFEGRTFSDYDKLDDANIKYYEENAKLKERIEELEAEISEWENNCTGEK